MGNKIVELKATVIKEVLNCKNIHCNHDIEMTICEYKISYEVSITTEK